MQRTIACLTAVGLLLSTATWAQEVQQSASIVSRDAMNQISAFSYREGPESELLLTGTALAAAASGEVEVEFQEGRSEIRSEVKDLPEPASLGPYTTYILWAITPDGRATNLGALETSSRGKGELDTSFSGSQFALIVAAEPHFAVSVPSSAVVLFNLAKKVKGEETKIASLAERADYSNLAKIAVDEKTAPVDLVAARYAVAIAAAAGADKYAAESLAAAQTKLDAAEAAQASKKSSERKQAPILAREATQAGEDARRAGMAGQAAADEETRRAASATAAASEAAEAQRVQSEQMAAETARNDLRNRLNAVLPTRETDRGLVSEIGGVQFATGTANLNAGARESLAKFAGVVASYPNLRYQVEGHTDNTGSAAKNQELSVKRALAVRDYLIGQGIAASATDVAGLGASSPIADNATADGRARNRRVEIVVSGGALGKK